jgi:uncharacterized protein with HEPN domain/predicted nucleotidyltransferase
VKEIQEADTMENKETHIDVNQIRLLILERKDEIKEKFKAEVVEIFGSYVRGEEKEGSDIDVLVRFEEGASLFDFTALEFYLEDLFGVPVDVVSERGLNPIIKDDILKGTAGGIKSPLLYLCEMLKAARNIKKFTEGMDKDTFLDNNKTKDAVVLQFEIIGEAAKSVSDDIKSLSPEIDWEDIIDIRDHLICTYFDIDYDRVWNTAIKDIPVLEQTIEKLLDELNSSNQGL